MRFRLPQGCARVSHAGKTIGASSDATIDLEADAASLLAPHGIVPIADREAIDATRIAGLVRSELLEMLAACKVAVPPRASNDALRGLLRQTLATSPR